MKRLFNRLTSGNVTRLINWSNADTDVVCSLSINIQYFVSSARHSSYTNY